MIATTISAVNTGIRGQIIEIECTTNKGLPGIVIVGLGGKSIEESKERIKNSIVNSGLEMPKKKITLNLAPSNVQKEGTGLDLGIAMAVLAASNQVNKDQLSNTAFVAEVGLDGKLRPVRGMLTIVRTLQRAGITRVFVAERNAKEAALINGIDVFGLKSLTDVYEHVTDKTNYQPQGKTHISPKPGTSQVDFCDIRGQEQAKRALEIAAAGGHNLLLSGPPGAGKSMLAKAFVSILPTPSVAELIEITELHSLAGTADYEVQAARPFRSPHHTASTIALIGGGKTASPGEISLAHRGVLFLDELPEYPRSVLESLRQPLEDRTITVARAAGTVKYPAYFQLIATQNPCPCGFFGDSKRSCVCSAANIQRYRSKLSGPLLDRIDLQFVVPKVEYSQMLSTKVRSEVSSTVQQRVQRARDRQSHRFKKMRILSNSEMSNKDIHALAAVPEATKQFLTQAAEKMDISARAMIRSLRVARTIADLDESTGVDVKHIAEALQFRISQESL